MLPHYNLHTHCMSRCNDCAPRLPLHNLPQGRLARDSKWFLAIAMIAILDQLRALPSSLVSAMHCNAAIVETFTLNEKAWGGNGHVFYGVLSGSGNVASGQQSDHLLMVAAFDGWQAAKGQVLSEPAHHCSVRHLNTHSKVRTALQPSCLPKGCLLAGVC